VGAPLPEEISTRRPHAAREDKTHRNTVEIQLPASLPAQLAAPDFFRTHGGEQSPPISFA